MGPDWLKQIRVRKCYRLVKKDNELIYLDIILFYLNVPVLCVGIVYTLKMLFRTPGFHCTSQFNHDIKMLWANIAQETS